MSAIKKVAISGASGLVGSALSARLRAQGVAVVPMVRSPEQEGIYWSVPRAEIDAEALAGVDAVVHLAGESLASGRWTRARKEAIYASRVSGSALIAGAMAEMEAGPRTLICASAVGYYGDTGDRWVDEEAPPGEGFLAEVCVAWEAACDPARKAGIRVVNTRLGVVLAREGGALPAMRRPFKLGVGGRLGSGQQYMSWIALSDVVGALIWALEQPGVEGPLNLVSPQPVTNAEFTRALGQALHRPAVVPTPGAALKLALGGEMAREMLLQGQRVRPARLEEGGYVFEHPELKETLGRLFER
ncbi:TIGR01777 family protein [Lujinxingia litoralis]|uniref:TIGR01777 family protein n=1 Tax=Lujinxingia litoralis TaxID=2211119 RepID=A0A328CB10_9DELT|nr:TIGR01777 family oxidoreductase [Lujinxingia litoralis]RAL22397.1 TIGR01777 family protein [Lujinxingia litoralis]